jgi:hypothetical protein
MEPGGVKERVKMPHEVSRSDLKKIRSKNFRVPGEPWLREGEGKGNRSNKREDCADDVAGKKLL